MHRRKCHSLGISQLLTHFLFVRHRHQTELAGVRLGIERLECMQAHIHENLLKWLFQLDDGAFMIFALVRRFALLTHDRLLMQTHTHTLCALDWLPGSLPLWLKMRSPNARRSHRLYRDLCPKHAARTYFRVSVVRLHKNTSTWSAYRDTQLRSIAHAWRLTFSARSTMHLKPKHKLDYRAWLTHTQTAGINTLCLGTGGTFIKDHPFIMFSFGAHVPRPPPRKVSINACYHIIIIRTVQRQCVCILW